MSIASMVLDVALGMWAGGATSFAVREYRKRTEPPRICMGAYTLHQWGEWNDCEPKTVRTSTWAMYHSEHRTETEEETPYQERRCLMCNELERRVVPLAAAKP